MTAATHDEYKEMTAAYVLGALEGAEREAFEAHLASCEECSAEARALGPVMTSLAQSAPRHRPDPALRARVLASAGHEAQSVAAPSGATSPSAPWWALAAMLLISVGIGIYAVQLNARVTDLEVRLASAEQQTLLAERAVSDARRVAFESQSAMAVLAAADLARIDLNGEGPGSSARARALWSRQSGMVFAVSQLPPAPEGKVYQVWVVTAEPAPISAGLLTPDSSGGAVTVFKTPVDIPAPVAVAVTLEPAGGVPAPTGARYLVGTVGA